MANLYTLKAIEDLIRMYLDKGGEMIQISEGVLGHGKFILCGKDLKTTIVREVYLNEWSSAHTIRMYNVTPKKYEKYVEPYV